MTQDSEKKGRNAMQKEIQTKDDFKKVMYSDPEEYNGKFSNEIAERENKEIQRILAKHIRPDSIVHDIGCGTGLGRELLGDTFTGDYYGIDNIIESVVHCRVNLKGIFLHETAEKFIEHEKVVNPLFIFSADYMDIETLEAYIQKTDEVFIAVHYNEPYLSQTSYYQDQEETFHELHPPHMQLEKLSLFERYGGDTRRLLDEDYYYVTVIKGNNYGRNKI